MKVKLKLLAEMGLYKCPNSRLGLMKFSHVDLAVGASLEENDKLWVVKAEQLCHLEGPEQTDVSH